MRHLLIKVMVLLPLCLHAGEIEDLVRAEVEKVLPPHLGVLSTRIRAQVPLPLDHVALMWDRSPRAGRLSLMGHFKKTHGDLQKAWVQIELGEKHRVLTAQRELTVGKVLEPGDLALDSHLLTTSKGLTLPDTLFVGRRILKRLASGQIVHRGDVEWPPPVPQGTPLRIVLQKHNVWIVAAGTLDRAAFPGQIAKARTQSRLVSGRLVDAHTLKIESENLP